MRSSNHNQCSWSQVPVIMTATERVTISSKWMLPTSSSVRVFSSVAYLVGLQLQQATGVPVGIVQSSYGEP